MEKEGGVGGLLIFRTTKKFCVRASRPGKFLRFVQIGIAQCDSCRGQKGYTTFAPENAGTNPNRLHDLI